MRGLLFLFFVFCVMVMQNNRYNSKWFDEYGLTLFVFESVR
jgi:hypothetical protein